MERLEHFNGSSQSCVYSDETTWRLRWKIPLENPWRRHFRDSKFQNVPTIDASAHLWCEFQSRLLFVISLLLRDFLTALNRYWERDWVRMGCLENNDLENKDLRPRKRQLWLPSKVVPGVRRSFFGIRKKKKKHFNPQIFSLSPDNL